MKFNSIQTLRALAASFVVFGHTAGEFKFIWLPNWLVVFGYSGVDLFFVISGFIIAYVANKNDGNPLRFAIKRYWRVFSLYWIVLLFAVLLNRIGIAHTPDWMHVYFPAHKYIFLQSTENRFIPPAWTLLYEIYFYSVVSIILFIPRRYFYYSILLWMVAQAAVYLRYGTDFDIFSNILVVEFGFGCLVAWLAQANHMALKFAYPALLTGIAAFAIGVYLAESPNGPNDLDRFSTFGIAGALLLYAFLAFERHKVIAFPRFLVATGNASYSLYLWHWPLAALLLYVGIDNGLGIVLIYVAAFLSFRFIESPLLRKETFAPFAMQLKSLMRAGSL